MERIKVEEKFHKFKHAGAVDADGHILEPADLWENYIEEKYKPKALRLRRDQQGVEYIEIGGRPSKFQRGERLSRFAAMGSVDRNHDLPNGMTYGQLNPLGAMDPKERIERLDKEGLDAALIYPTLSLSYETELQDVELAQAYTRAYNRWIADFCRDSGGRLVPIAHLSLGDPDEAARELERAVKDGCRGAFVAPFTLSRRPHGDPAHDRIFAIAQDHNVPFAIHPTLEPPAWGVHHRYDKFGWAAWYFDLFAGHGVQHAFATFFQTGVFERFPKLKVIVLESGAGWIGYFLDRGDAIISGTRIGQTVQLREKPSYYFKRQCFISADPDERTIVGLMPLVGENKFFWASDYPHPDHPGNYLEELHEMVEPMTESGRRGIVGENVARAYGLI